MSPLHEDTDRLYHNFGQLDQIVELIRKNLLLANCEIKNGKIECNFNREERKEYKKSKKG